MPPENCNAAKLRVALASQSLGPLGSRRSQGPFELKPHCCPCRTPAELWEAGTADVDPRL